MGNTLRVLAAAALMALATSVAMAQAFSALRGSTPLDQEGAPPIMTPEKNTSIREPRNYPEQPPLIPHTTEGYAVTADANNACHAMRVRARATRRRR